MPIQCACCNLLRCILVLFLLVPICFSASPLTPEEIAAAYSEKLDLLQPYRVRYKVTNTTESEDGTDKVLTRVIEILVDSPKYRKSVWTETTPGGQLVHVLTEIDNGAEQRNIRYSTSGRPGSGQILSPQPDSAIYDQLVYSPIGLAGLHDSSSVYTPGSGSGFPLMTDIRALALEPDAVLHTESETLDGAEAYVIEWPKTAPRPDQRWWLSADGNLSLLKYESYRLDTAGEYVTLTRSTNRDFGEILPGLYVPKRSEFQRLAFDPQLPPQTIALELISIDLAVPVKDSDFLLEFPEDIHVLRTVFSWREHRWSVENATFEKARIIVSIGFLVMFAALVILVFRSRRGAR